MWIAEQLLQFMFDKTTLMMLCQTCAVWLAGGEFVSSHPVRSSLSTKKHFALMAEPSARLVILNTTTLPNSLSVKNKNNRLHVKGKPGTTNSKKRSPCHVDCAMDMLTVAVVETPLCSLLIEDQIQSNLKA